MITRIALAALAAALIAPLAHADEQDWRPEGRDSAIAACLDYNGYKPANLRDATEDGLGDWIVWVKDKDGDLWLCNANGKGDVYANVVMNGDLLKGQGDELVANAGGGPHPGPAESAERLCAAVGSYMEDLEITETVDDGLGDYLVWLKNGKGAYWMCNASSDHKLYAFEAVQYPVNAPTTSSNDTCCAPYEDRRG